MSIQNFANKNMEITHTPSTPDKERGERATTTVHVREYLQELLHPSSERGRMLGAFKAALQVQSTHSSLKKKLPLFIEFIELGGSLDKVPEDLKTLQLGYVPKPELEAVDETLRPRGVLDEKVWLLHEVLTKETVTQERIDAIEKAVGQLSRGEDIDITNLLK